MGLLSKVLKPVGKLLGGGSKGGGGPAGPTEADLLMQGIAQAMAGLQAPASNVVRPQDQTKRIAATPGYQFAKQEGIDSILNNASALGLRKSGATAGSLGQYVGNSLAFPAYQDYMNRLSALSGGAQTASSGLGGTIGNILANNSAITSGLTAGAGNVLAAGQLGQAGAWQNSISDLSGVLGDYFGNRPAAYTPTGGNYRRGDEFMPPTN